MVIKNRQSRDTGNNGHMTQKTKELSDTDTTKKTRGEPKCSRRV